MGRRSFSLLLMALVLSWCLVGIILAVTPSESSQAEDEVESTEADDLDYEFDEEEDDEFDNFDEKVEDFAESPSYYPETPESSTPIPTKSYTPSLFGGLDDISATGNCSVDIEKECKGLPKGKGSILSCLSSKVVEESAAGAVKTISQLCKDEIRAFKIEMYKNISMDAKLSSACQKDIEEYCNDDDLYPEPGNVLACLREAKQEHNLSPACKVEIFRAKFDAAQDFEMDPQLYAQCSADASKYCAEVLPGEGRIQTCLRINGQKLGWDCQAELFRQEFENAADIRLNYRLFQSCLVDKMKFCSNVTPGDARVLDCLEQHRLDPDFSPSCKHEFDQMMERRASDFRLDPNLRKYCKQDIEEICYPDADDITDVASWDAKVIQCLQDYRDELKYPKCRQQVRLLTMRAAEDIRFDKPFSDACHGDRVTICKNVPDGMALVLRCLQDNRDALKETCRSSLYDQEVRMVESIDFQFSMKKVCTKEITNLCNHIPPVQGAVIKCLQEKIADPEMGADCKAEVKRSELHAAQDYRLNYRLNKACYDDVQKICLHVCDKNLEAGNLVCGGAVLKCLSENKTAIESEACKEEVFAFEKQEAQDINLDVPLQTACKSDLKALCPKVSRDHSRTLACLRKNRDSLSPDCKAEELRFSEMEASDIRLTPMLMNACGQELQLFCRSESPTEGKAFRCLQSNLEKVGMSSACKVEVNLQEQRMASDYRLDVTLKNVCSSEVERNCADVRDNGHALVLKCLVKKFKILSGSCQTEVSYAVQSALWQYHLEEDLTQPCDSDVQKNCLNDDVKPINGFYIGVFGQCLMGQNLTMLNDECRQLVKLAAKNGSHVGGKINDADMQVAVDQLSALQAAGGGGFVLSGWVAIGTTLVVLGLFFGAGYAIYLNYYTPTSDYILVVASGDV